MTSARLQYLFEQCLNERDSPEERSELQHLLQEQVHQEQVLELFSGALAAKEAGTILSQDKRSAILDSIFKAGMPVVVKEPEKDRGSFLPIVRNLRTTPIWLRYAAAVILVIGVAVYFLNIRNSASSLVHTPAHAPAEKDVLPGSNKAILLLSNGQKIALDSASSQIIAEGNSSISNEQGILIYKKSDVVVFNTMMTPKGGQYRLMLSDGSKVWLNATSSITYPTTFTGNEREVSITGEVYFEVAKNARKPFIVKSNNKEIRVLGTSFNVNGYTDEPDLKISLLEGSVRVDERVLKPGQAYLNGEVVDTDLDQDLAWKNGVFNFNNADLFVVMRQLSRWYNIDLKYEGKIKARVFQGEMDRELTLSQVVKILGETGVKFRIEKNQLIVSE